MKLAYIDNIVFERLMNEEGFRKMELEGSWWLEKDFGSGCALLVDPHGAVIENINISEAPPETTVADYSVSFSDMSNFVVGVLLEKGYLNIYED